MFSSQGLAPLWVGWYFPLTTWPLPLVWGPFWESLAHWGHSFFQCPLLEQEAH
jgi:hypothetical protein